MIELDASSLTLICIAWNGGPYPATRLSSAGGPESRQQPWRRWPAMTRPIRDPSVQQAVLRSRPQTAGGSDARPRAPAR